MPQQIRSVYHKHQAYDWTISRSYLPAMVTSLHEWIVSNGKKTMDHQQTNQHLPVAGKPKILVGVSKCRYKLYDFQCYHPFYFLFVTMWSRLKALIGDHGHNLWWFFEDTDTYLFLVEVCFAKIMSIWHRGNFEVNQCENKKRIHFSNGKS